MLSFLFFVGFEVRLYEVFSGFQLVIAAEYLLGLEYGALMNGHTYNGNNNYYQKPQQHLTCNGSSFPLFPSNLVGLGLEVE